MFIYLRICIIQEIMSLYPELHMEPREKKAVISTYTNNLVKQLEKPQV